ncbi:uncharacterized protein LOC120713759 isoform X2 [Panicum virgatum]|uniref:Uncharacterized protein n=1 Tax=Panicum virgatum TaxID=38727 RepID=A0A8T0RJD7_PANVG|nr:uncharacterized protein LOC120713759 isoform X2 [Panicum virgatum]KAG2585574.1 hypothetical protein PVAP13_6KG398933 [Panicum virgatum]
MVLGFYWFFKIGARDFICSQQSKGFIYQKTSVQFFLSEPEQSSTESRVLDGAQNLDVSSGNNKDEQEPHENGSVVVNNNGELNHSRNERILNGNADKEAPDGHFLSKQTYPIR